MRYTTVKKQTTIEKQTIQKSVFLAYVKGVDTVEEARDFYLEISKKHYDATHNCYAYVVDDKVKFSDDGEPQGTAGMPILQVIQKKNLNRVCVVVTRYFGGVKLGAGGLVRAYSSTAVLGLDKAEKVHVKPCQIVEVHCNYTDYQVLQNFFKANSMTCDVAYTDQVIATCKIDLENVQDFTKKAVELACGRATITLLGQIQGEE